MRHASLRVFAGVATATLFGFPAIGQPIEGNPPPEECVAEDLLPPVQEGDCLFLFDLFTAYGYEEQIISPVSYQDTDHSEWIVNQACQCRYVRIGETLLNCSNVSQQYNKSREVCWESGGGTSFNFRVGVAFLAVSEVGGEEYFSHAQTKCHTYGTQTTITVPPNQCWTFGSQAFRRRASCDVVVNIYAAYRGWLCEAPNGNPRIVTNYCGKETYTASAQHWPSIELRHMVQPPPPCNYTPPIDEGPELQRFAIPCCKQIPECQGVPPNQLPCCGVEREH
jgi:hypothetical protein